MRDTALADNEQIWVAEHFSGRILQAYKNIAAFQGNNSDNIDVEKFFHGCGHIVHRGSLYFHMGGTSKIIKYDLETKRHQTLSIDNALHSNLSYLLHNSKTYFKMAADENGLWIVFASSLDDTIMVAQLDEQTFSVSKYINTSYPRTKAGNAFIACGVLYVTDTKDCRVAYAFDLLKEKPVNVSFDMRSSADILAMLSYLPQEKVLLAWDNNYVKSYKVHFLSDERGVQIG